MNISINYFVLHDLKENMKINFLIELENQI